MFFIAYDFIGQVHVFTGPVKIIITRPEGQGQYLNILFPCNFFSENRQNISIYVGAKTHSKSLILPKSSTAHCGKVRVFCVLTVGLEVIKLEFILRLKIKRNDWLLADTCLQAANQYALF